MAGGQSVKVNFSVNASNYTDAMKQIIKANRDMASSAGQAGHATVSSMQASSAAIRALENPLGNNLRAVERFLTTLPGVGDALRSAFPVVGAVAFGSVLVKLTKDVVDFVNKVNSIPAALSLAAQSQHISMQETLDELDLQIVKTQNARLLLEGKPKNRLAEAIAEGRVEADKLYDSLKRSSDEIAQVLKKNQVGTFEGLALGKKSTSPAETLQSQALNDLASIKGQNLPPAQTQQLLKKRLEKLVDDSSKGLEGLNKNYDFFGTDVDAARSAYNAIRQNAQDQIQQISKTDQLQKQQQLTGKTPDYKQAMEAQRKALEEGLTNQERTGGAYQQDGKSVQKVAGIGTTPAEIAGYWQSVLDANASGQSKLLKGNVEFVTSKLEAASEQNEKAWDENHKRIEEKRKKDADELARHDQEFLEQRNVLSKAQNELQDKMAESSERLNRANAEAVEIQKSSAAVMAEAQLRIREATGAISGQDAAVVQASIHQEEYNAKLAALRSEQANIIANPLSDPDKQNQRYQANQNAQDQLTGQFAAQQVLDQADIANQGFVNQWKTSLSQMSNDFTNFAKGLSAAFGSTLNGVNDEIVKVLTAKRVNGREVNRAFADAGKSGATELVSTGLKGVEGTFLKAFGLGAKPMHVIVDNLPRGSSGGYSAGADASLDEYLAGAPTRGGGDNGSGIGGALSGLIKTIAPIVPFVGYASGGPVGPNVPIIVGERGPEVFMPNSSGNIIPNHKLGRGGGDTHHHHHNYNVDARGSQNPGETAKVVTRALQRAAPTLMAKTLMAEMDRRARLPRLRG